MEFQYHVINYNLFVRVFYHNRCCLMFWIDKLFRNVLFWNVFIILEKKDMRYVLKIFWNIVDTCCEIEDITLYLIHIYSSQMSSEKYIWRRVFWLVSSSIVVCFYNLLCINMIPNATVIKGMFYSITLY